MTIGVVAAEMSGHAVVCGASQSCDTWVDLLTDVVYGVIIIGGALVIAAEVNDSGWTAVLTALELTLTSPAPPEESLLAW